MPNLRAGLIGLGMMGRHHARVLSSLDGVDLVAVADPGGDRFRSVEDRLLVDDVHKLIDLGIDYCVVAAPTVFHEELALALAEANVHALVEKPLAFDVESATRVADAFRTRDLIGGVGHIERFNAALQQARKRIREGLLGDIYQIATRRQGPFPARISDVGVIRDLGTHDIDLTAWVAGQDYVSVSARTARRSGREIEDLVAVSGQLAGGTITNHLVNWLSPYKERTCVITGERGALVADTLTADLTYFSNGTVEAPWSGIANFRGVTEGDVTRYAFAKPEPLRVEHEEFRNAVLGQPADIVTMEQGLKTVTVAAACYASAREGTVINIDQPSGGDAGSHDSRQHTPGREQGES